MRGWLTRVWYEGAPGARLLAPLAALYGTAVARRRAAYATGRRRAIRVARPVIVVGNLTVGGTGKTPLVAWLAERLAESGLEVGIASRGYGGAARAPLLVEATTPWQRAGDEPLLLRERTGCLTAVAADRVAAAEALIAAGAEVIVCDDGLQHLRLARDCEIVVIDGERRFGNGRLLPAGPLREPPSRLAAVDAVVVNGGSEGQAAHCGAGDRAVTVHMRLAPGAARAVGDAAAPRPLGDFAGEPVHAVAGIGNPQRFFALLRSHGLELIEHPFPDHHPFGAGDLRFGDALPVLMTEKDAVKCRAFADARLWCVPVTAQLAEAASQALLARVRERLERAVAERR